MKSHSRPRPQFVLVSSPCHRIFPDQSSGCHIPPHRGFTLLEMLIVISIIGVLAALVFIVSSSMKSTAYKARELANLRDISMGVLTYQAERQVLPGPCFRGLPIPSKIPDSERARWLPTILIDAGYLNENDDTFFTFTNTPEDERYVAFVCNNAGYTIPTRFFGYPGETGTRGRPKALSTLQSNKSPSRGGREYEMINNLWMLCTADQGMYSNHPSIRYPASGYSKWNGRFYSYFDGRVEFIPKRTPSIYPSIDLDAN